MTPRPPTWVFSKDWSDADRVRLCVLFTHVFRDDFTAGRYGRMGRPNIQSLHELLVMDAEGLEAYRSTIEAIAGAVEAGLDVAPAIAAASGAAPLPVGSWQTPREVGIAYGETLRTANDRFFSVMGDYLGTQNHEATAQMLLGYVSTVPEPLRDGVIDETLKNLELGIGRAATQGAPEVVAAALLERLVEVRRILGRYKLRVV